MGKTIVGMDVRNKHKVSILAVKENDVLYPMPSPEHVFKKEENLLMMGKNEDIDLIIKKN